MRTILFFFLTLIATTTVLAQTKPQKKDTIQQKTELLEEVIISGNALIGSKFQARNKTGSANYISQEDLQKYSYTTLLF